MSETEVRRTWIWLFYNWETKAKRIVPHWELEEGKSMPEPEPGERIYMFELCLINVTPETTEVNIPGRLIREESNTTPGYAENTPPPEKFMHQLFSLSAQIGPWPIKSTFLDKSSFRVVSPDGRFKVTVERLDE